MGDFIKNVVIITATLIVSIIASAYVWYFVGMTVSLAAISILGTTGVFIAQTFAWIGVGFVVVLVTVFTTHTAIETARAAADEREVDEFFKELETLAKDNAEEDKE